MCKFCYKIGESKEKQIHWAVRSCYADQNIEDYNGEPAHDGKHRIINSEGFQITAYKHKDDNVYVGIEYRMKTSDGFIISPFSETIQWSFCPFCGEQISQDIVLAEDIYKHQFEIEDEDYEFKI